MKYEEYQIWYHVYTSVASSIAALDASDVIKKADEIAVYAVNKFKEIEELPQKPNIDIQSIVDKVIKENKRK